MPRHVPFAVCVFALLGCLTAGGCGSHDGKSPAAASISGAGGGQPQNPAGDPAAAPDKLHPLVVIHTSAGDITVKLDAEHSPISVDNFLTYIEQGHYDNTLIHQVLAKPAVILGGGYDTFQKEKPVGLPIRNEAHNGLKNTRGTIGMARRPDMIDSSTSQFYINCADNPQLDHKSKVADGVRRDLTERNKTPAEATKTDEADGYGYCVFGEVVRGMEVVDQISKMTTRDTPQLTSTPAEQVVVQWIHVAR